VQHRSAALRMAAAVFATVTWSFYETSCTPQTPFAGSLCPDSASSVTLPYLLARLVLPSATSTGTASWENTAPPGQPPSPPILAGDADFSFVPALGSFIAPPTYGTNAFCPFGFVPGAICSYDISWTEIAGQLVAIQIDYLTISSAEIRLGLTGGRIASDFTIGGCPLLGTCEVTGFWASDLEAIPEPTSAALALAVLLTLPLLWRRNS
jgi:hypothetical protein